MPEANIVKSPKAKVKHVDANKRTGPRWPFPLPALEVGLFPGQIFVDLGTHKRTKKKQTFVCDFTLWLIVIKMIKPNELLFGYFHFSFPPLLSLDTSSVVNTLCSSKIFSDVKFSLSVIGGF